jgi:hypothetical protein
VGNYSKECKLPVLVLAGEWRTPALKTTSACQKARRLPTRLQAHWQFSCRAGILHSPMSLRASIGYHRALLVFDPSARTGCFRALFKFPASRQASIAICLPCPLAILRTAIRNVCLAEILLGCEPSGKNWHFLCLAEVPTTLGAWKARTDCVCRWSSPLTWSCRAV